MAALWYIWPMAKENKYVTALRALESRGVFLDAARASFVGVRASMRYPFGDKALRIELSYSSLFHSCLVEFHIPYSPSRGPLMDEYDRVFPEEKSLWGRSTPPFPRAIQDYMRGQAHSGTVVELREHKTLLYIRFSVVSASGGVNGLNQVLERISFEMRKGMIHGDVLTHMFAI